MGLLHCHCSRGTCTCNPLILPPVPELKVCILVWICSWRNSQQEPALHPQSTDGWNALQAAFFFFTHKVNFAFKLSLVQCEVQPAVMKAEDLRSEAISSDRQHVILIYSLPYMRP